MSEPHSAEIGKKAAAEAAVHLVADGMTLGLGTGSTVAFALDALARRIQAEGLRIRGVATSERTAARARALGIALTDLAAVPELDLAIDGADEVEEASLCLIKGHGGALLREKIVASSARRFVVIVDESKVVPRLGTRMSVPVEVVRFAHVATARRLERLAGPAVLRPGADGAPFITDNGNVIYDVQKSRADRRSRRAGARPRRDRRRRRERPLHKRRRARDRWGRRRRRAHARRRQVRGRQARRGPVQA